MAKLNIIVRIAKNISKYFLVQRTQTEGLARRPEGKSLHRHTLLGEGIGHERTREQILCVLEVTHLQLTHF